MILLQIPLFLKKKEELPPKQKNSKTFAIISYKKNADFLFSYLKHRQIWLNKLANERLSLEQHHKIEQINYCLRAVFFFFQEFL
jgi:hypothetical protein